VLAALLFAAAGVILEAVLFRVFLDLRPELGLTGQRLGALGAVLGFVFLLLMLELAVAARVFDFGRRLEVRLRAAFLEKLPRLADRYFHSRLASDMAERSHSIHQMRLLPEMGSQFLRWSFELALTAAAIGWLDRALALPAMLAAALAVGLPLAAQPLLAERDLRLRSHTGALSRFYLDALLGLVAIRTHGGEGAVRREHGGILAEWARAGFALQRAGVAVQAAQLFGGFGLAAWMVLDHVARQAESGSVLLLLYWVLNLPVLGQEIALIAWQYPGYRNLTLRLLEPLGAPEEPPAPQAPLAQGPRTPGVALSLERVSVRAAGRTILEDIDLRVEPGGHVAIVGPSGAGKSSLVGLLLGWHPAACGRVLVDGAPLDACGLEQLRRDTAWVDAAVHLWNRSVLENLRYGLAGEEAMPLGEAIDRAGLHPVLEKLPDGLQTILGEGGALVSGGEGQRVRLARALLRPGARLVILDEPFAGLERGLRRELLARCRERWRSCTFLCITHDIAETLEFPRVVVMEAGRLVEDGVPAELARRPGSRFRALLEAEEQVRERLWGGPHWRRLRLARGRLLEEDVPSLGALWEEEEASCRRRDR
jgi:ATP-binding cassette subfamily B protein